MTDHLVGVLIMLVGLAVILFSRRKKRQNASARGGVVFIEMAEIRKRPKVPMFVVNLVIGAGIVTFIWVMNR
jgi:uncharacterized membrane protein